MVAIFYVRDGGGLDCRRSGRWGDRNAFGCVFKIELIGFAYRLDEWSEEKRNACKVSS